MADSLRSEVYACELRVLSLLQSSCVSFRHFALMSKYKSPPQVYRTCKLRAFDHRTNNTKPEQPPKPHKGGTEVTLPTAVQGPRSRETLSPFLYSEFLSRGGVALVFCCRVKLYIRQTRPAATHSVQTLHATQGKESYKQPAVQAPCIMVVWCYCIFCSIVKTEYTSERTMTYVACAQTFFSGYP